MYNVFHCTSEGRKRLCRVRDRTCKRWTIVLDYKAGTAMRTDGWTIRSGMEIVLFILGKCSIDTKHKRCVKQTNVNNKLNRSERWTNAAMAGIRHPLHLPVAFCISCRLRTRDRFDTRAGRLCPDDVPWSTARQQVYR